MRVWIILLCVFLYLYFAYRILVRHESFKNACLLPIRYVCDKTGFWPLRVSKRE